MGSYWQKRSSVTTIILLLLEFPYTLLYCYISLYYILKIVYYFPILSEACVAPRHVDASRDALLAICFFLFSLKKKMNASRDLLSGPPSPGEKCQNV